MRILLIKLLSSDKKFYIADKIRFLTRAPYEYSDIEIKNGMNFNKFYIPEISTGDDSVLGSM